MLSTRPVAARPHDLDRDGLAAVDDLVADEVERRGRVLVAVDPSLHEVVERTRSLASGGKRLRAAFCLWAARGAAGPATDDDGHPARVRAAAALEVFHLAALVHDDVMDRSQSRRGTVAVHRAFADLHHDAGFRGDGRTFGDAAAVLVGDLCLTWSDDLMAAAVARQGPRGEAARGVWQRMRDEVLAGQYLDLLAQARPTTTTALTERVLRYKSAKYTVEHPLLIGGALAGGSPDLLDCYSEFGLRVGEAFQLRDDVLGVLGDPSVTGKPVADDVREGKRTLLVALAEERADARQQAVLDRHLGDPDLGPAGLAAVQRVLDETGALDRVEDRISRRMAEAHAVLDALPVDDGARHALRALSDACAWREA